MTTIFRGQIAIFCLASWKLKGGKARRHGKAKRKNNQVHSQYSLTLPRAIIAWSASNVTAGADTTAILLRTIFYNLLKHPSSLERLTEELKAAATRGELSRIVSWKESQKLPYLDACIKEAGRLHPPFCLPFERIVPAEGAVISGKPFKAGTVVGISPYVVHRDRETFGEDVEVWRPERWLCEEGSRRRMEHALLTVRPTSYKPRLRAQ